jgi:hypothetical protein
MNVLLVSADPEVREMMALVTRSVRRRLDEPFTSLEASDGIEGIRMAWRHVPDTANRKEAV